ncbi:MAG: hypothetical protein M1118_08845 [Chloroflexi bacterium]|nr:hypothetical protein [Chloroflexota bacterium]
MNPPGTPATQHPRAATPVYDGRWLVLSVQRRQGAPLSGDRWFTDDGIAREMVGSEVLVVDTESGVTLRPFPEAGCSWGARWSPDGRPLAVYVQ